MSVTAPVEPGRATWSSCSAPPAASAAWPCRPPGSAAWNGSSPSARSAERLAALGDLADAAVTIDGDDLTGRIAAAGARPPTVVIDVMWGAPAVAAMLAAAAGARIVQLGTSAGAEGDGAVGGGARQAAVVLGYSNFGLARPSSSTATDNSSTWRNDGRITIDVERFPLSDVGAAWDATVGGRGKAVVVPATRRWQRGRSVIVEVIMPKVGIYEDDVELVEWLVADGSTVEVGDPLFVMETEKVSTEIEAEDEGILVRTAAAGYKAPVGSRIGLFG